MRIIKSAGSGYKKKSN